MSINEGINAELHTLPDEAPAQERLGAVFRAYSHATNDPLPADPSTEQRKAVVSWLRAQDDLLALSTLGMTRLLSRGFLVHTTTSSKATRLVQFACPTCGPRERHFPVDVDPWSAQANKLKVAIREGVTTQLAKGHGGRSMPMIPSGPVCLSIVAVVPMAGGRVKKDVDNLVKGLIDAMSGIIYNNDDQVQCLTVRRLEYSGTRGHYMVGVRRAENLSDDIIDEDPDGATIVWAPRHNAP
ncbi:Holliday junction resolvase RusA-like endonuclease [Frigoribacterium sp. PhB160]|uniref:RusA family crossover junction endodeoxyribonuclease n=1 Tax=Frigoribacterium sp. PhB160 TaxID=2485192 RepID=UPI000F952D9A|nr:RusA family crossover junction endodeoxyribonuclease [Frigoribacterium sp. PhB160]ROS58349.1 Holliday junction resolvase RusA-like endonuclease [Frigoribacterium sp. PhB160]